MNWIERIFGLRTPEPETVSAAGGQEERASAPLQDEKPAKQSRRKKEKALTVLAIAKRFAREVPGATIEDFGDVPRDDRLLVRVTYVFEGVTSRLAIMSDPEDFSKVWLETRTIGKFGSFDVCRTEPGATYEVDEPRFFLSPTSFISGQRLRNEVARVLMLAPAARERLLALSAQVQTVGLAEQVMVAFLGDALALWDLLEDKAKGAASVLWVGNELAFLGNQLPALAQEVAVLAEARTCRFCGGSFIFAPSKPTCTGCGAPAEAAPAMPPTSYAEIPDNPILQIDEDEREDHEEMMAKVRACARALSEQVAPCQVREEPERGRVFVEYTLDGRAYRVKFMEDYAGIRVAAPGAKGDFYLSWSSVHVMGAEEGSVWRESERRVFFSEHCSVCSDHTTKEAARIASLPVLERELLLELCDRYRGGAQLEDGYLSKNMDIEGPEHGVQEVLKCSRELAQIAAALPRDFDPEDTWRYRLEFCGHCRWEYFLEAHKPSCAHCGAPAKGAAT